MTPLDLLKKSDFTDLWRKGKYREIIDLSDDERNIAELLMFKNSEDQEVQKIRKLAAARLAAFEHVIQGDEKETAAFRLGMLAGLMDYSGFEALQKQKDRLSSEALPSSKRRYMDVDQITPDCVLIKTITLLHKNCKLNHKEGCFAASCEECLSRLFNGHYDHVLPLVKPKKEKDV